MATILDQIIQTKVAELAEAQRLRPLAELKRAVRDAEPARDMFAALSAPPPGTVHVIAEIKRKSPSAGLIRADFDPAAIARIYHAANATAISVLTDQPWFDGRLEYIQQVKAVVPRPVLRKDFIIDAYQLYQSRAAGADAILLIGEVLPPGQLHELLQLSCELGMTTLVEVHEEQVLDGLLAQISFPNSYRSLLGINNRDLKVQRTDLAATERLIQRVGVGTIVVSESGIKTREDVQRVAACGARAVLIGESLMAQTDIASKMAELFAIS